MYEIARNKMLKIEMKIKKTIIRIKIDMIKTPVMNWYYLIEKKIN